MTNHIRRRQFITLLGGTVAGWPLTARAQQPARIRRIGVLMGLAEKDPEAQARMAAIRDELRKQGWTEGQNVRFDLRWTAGDIGQNQTFAKELVELEPDVILAHATVSTAALLRLTRTIPIVFAQVSDPVASGFVQSFARPGGNATGFTNYEYPTIGEKWLQLLNQIAPRVTRVAIVFNPDTTPYEFYLRSIKAAAPAFAIEPVALPVHDTPEIERAISSFAQVPNGGLLVLPDFFTGSHREPIIAQASQNRLPAIYPYRFFAVNGGLISYGIEPIDIYRRAGSYIARILKGEKPADLPVQAPVKYEGVINLKTAKALSLDVPAKLLALTDEVIE